MFEPMRIVWLSPYSPWPAHHGGKLRLYNLVRELVARGHSIELWCVCPEPAEWSSAQHPRLSIRRFPARQRKSMADKLAALTSGLPEAAWAVTGREVVSAIRGLRSEPPDVVVLEQAAFAPLRQLLKEIGVPFVLDAQNVEWWLTKQIASSQRRLVTRSRFMLDARRFRRLESELVQSATAVINVSADDACRLKALGPMRAHAIHPSGVDLEYFTWTDHAAPRGRRLLMTGTLGYMPNLDACRWIAADIMPRVRRSYPDARIDLVGGAAEAALQLHAPQDGIHVVGPVPDVRSFMAAADVFVVPLRMGSGTRLKVLEAMAAGIPVVGTSVAVEGLRLPDGAAVVVDSAEGLAAGICDVIADQNLRAGLSRTARKFVEAYFSWRDIAAAFEVTLCAIARSSS